MNTINYRIKSMQVTSSCIDPKKYTKEGEIVLRYKDKADLQINS